MFSILESRRVVNDKNEGRAVSYGAEFVERTQNGNK